MYILCMNSEGIESVTVDLLVSLVFNELNLGVRSGVCHCYVSQSTEW